MHFVVPEIRFSNFIGNRCSKTYILLYLPTKFVASTDVIHLDAYEKPYLIWCLNAEAVLIKWIYLCFQALKDYKYS